MATQKIKFRGADISLQFAHKEAMFVFPKLGLNLLRIFHDQEVMLTILSDDEVMIKVWYHFVKDHCSSLEDAVEDLTPEMMAEFKDKFWEQTVSFTHAPMRRFLRQMKELVEKELSSTKMLTEQPSLES